LAQLPEPPTARIFLLAGPGKNGASPMDEQRAQVAIPPLADAEQSWGPPTRLLLRHQPEPGRELATVLEASLITDCGNEGCRAQRPYAFDLARPLARFPGPIKLANASVIDRDPSVDLSHFILHLDQETTHKAVQRALTVSKIGRASRRG